MTRPQQIKLTIQSIATEFQVNRATVWRWRKEGKLPKPDYLIGDRPYWDRETLYQFIKSSL